MIIFYDCQKGSKIWQANSHGDEASSFSKDTNHAHPI